MRKIPGNLNITFLFQNIAVCNAGLVNGLTKEDILLNFGNYGEIIDIVLLPRKSCCFVRFKDKDGAEKAYHAIHGKLNIAQYNKPLYLTFTEKSKYSSNLNFEKTWTCSIMIVKIILLIYV